MRKLVGILLTFVGVAVLLAQAVAQQPPAQDKGKDFSTSSIVTGMMAFDKNKTGKLTKEMVTDPRLHRLFDQADANKDGVVTKEELIALAAKLDAEYGPGGKGGFGKGKGGKGPKGKGGLGKGPPGKDAPDKGPPDKGPPDKGAIPGKGAGGEPGGGFGGPKGGPPQPGQILPPFLQDRLNLTDAQRARLKDLQREVDDKLGKILTDEQRQQLKELRERGPGGFGGGGFGFGGGGFGGGKGPGKGPPP